MIQVKGEYTLSFPLQTMFLNEKIFVKGTNLITLQGESFFMNRWINNEFEPLKYIVLGKATARPLKTDETLGQETVRKTCTGKANIKTKKLELSCDVTASEILDTTEIGVANDEVLISHDIYRKISSTFLGNNTSMVHVNYTFSLVTGSVRGDWKVFGDAYYLYEPNTVVGVVEANSGSGYNQVNSKNDLISGSYFYDANTRNVFIKTFNSNNPNDIEIIVQTK